MSNWIYFLLGFLSGIILMFIISRIAELIRVIAITKYYQQLQKKEGDIGAEEIKKIRERLDIARGERGDKRRS